MQFKEGDYIFYGSGGICRIDSICEMPFEGAKEGVPYYVLHTLAEPKQVIWNPVENDKVLMRAVLTRDEAENVLSSLTSLTPLEAPCAKLLREQYIGAMKSCDPTEWARVIHTYSVRRRAAEAKLLRVTEAERNFHDNAIRLLAAEVALVLGATYAEAEARIRAIDAD